MTQDEIIETANKASKEWLKELPTPEETANQVPKRFLEIFAALVAAKEREACAKVCEDGLNIATCFNALDDMEMWGEKFAKAIRARDKT
jgi:DNA phosphorothioation-dependent restriction protein DptG